MASDEKKLILFLPFFNQMLTLGLCPATSKMHAVQVIIMTNCILAKQPRDSTKTCFRFPLWVFYSTGLSFIRAFRVGCYVVSLPFSLFPFPGVPTSFCHYPTQWSPMLSMHENHLVEWLNPQPCVFIQSGWVGLRTCIPTKFPGEAGTSVGTGPIQDQRSLL